MAYNRNRSLSNDLNLILYLNKLELYNYFPMNSFDDFTRNTWNFFLRPKLLIDHHHTTHNKFFKLKGC